MDISKIDDIKELKAIAYDQRVALENTQRNLQIVTARINEVTANTLQEQGKVLVKTTEVKKPDEPAK